MVRTFSQQVLEDVWTKEVIRVLRVVLVLLLMVTLASPVLFMTLCAMDLADRDVKPHSRVFLNSDLPDLRRTSRGLCL